MIAGATDIRKKWGGGPHDFDSTLYNDTSPESGADEAGGTPMRYLTRYRCIAFFYDKAYVCPSMVICMDR
jgi:hypothetical protein